MVLEVIQCELNNMEIRNSIPDIWNKVLTHISQLECIKNQQ